MYTYTGLLLIPLAAVLLGVTHYMLGRLGFRKKKYVRVQEYKAYLDLSSSFIRSTPLQTEVQSTKKVA